MTPPIATHHQLVLLERARALARLEKARIEREQRSAMRSHSQPGRRVGLRSVRGISGELLIKAGKSVAGREWLEHRKRAAISPASAHR